MTSFAYAKLGGRDFGLFRIQGSGLGNLLLPWARAVRACHRYGLRMITPTWPQLKVGPILRREADYRFYTGLFRVPAENLHGWRRLWRLAFLPRAPEAALSPGEVEDGGDRVFVFSGMDGFFEPLLSDHELIRRELIRMTLPSHLAGFERDFEHSISVHVRCGDFATANAESLRRGVDNMRLPIEWYVEVVDRLRARYDPPPAICVFSDGRDDELEPLLEIPGAKRLDFGSSIADMLALSKARVLVASASTFSMWASYLGRMPVVWYPGQLRQRLYSDRPHAEIEWGAGDEIPDTFFDAIQLG